MPTDALAHRAADHPIEPLFLRRWSPRAMSGEGVSPGELMTLLEAARWAPSSFNAQPWRFLYARRDTAAWPRLFGLLAEFNQSWCVSAAALIVVVTRKTFEHNGQPNPVHLFDAGAAWAQLALQATVMGLVAHGMAGFDFERARTELKVPDDFAVAAMIAVGRPGAVQSLPEPLREREQPSPRRPVAASALEGGFDASPVSIEAASLPQRPLPA